MHWCVNINALQRPFQTASCNQKSLFSSVKYDFLLVRPEIPGHQCCLVADSIPGRKEDVEREWIENDFTFQLPRVIHKASYVRYTEYCVLWLCITHMCNRTFSCYLYTNNLWGEILQIWSQPRFQAFPELAWDQRLFFWGGVEGYGVVLQKQTGISSEKKKRTFKGSD